MSRELSRIGWRAEFFPAIRPPEPAGFSSIGARGCFLSHLAVLKQAAQGGIERLTILEDDLGFSGDFLRRWPVALEALQAREWALFYPGHILDELPNGLSLLPPSTGMRCTHFMVISGSAIPMLIDGLEKILSRPAGHPLGGPMHVDGAYSTIRVQNPTLATYAYAPVLGYQRPSRSDIATNHWWDRTPVFSTAASYARQLKSGLKRTWS
jgi:hypothetical protein